MVKISIQGASAIRKLLERAPEIAKQEVRRGLTQSAFVVEANAVQEAPADTGTLRKSIETDLDLPSFRATIEAKAEYAESVHEGHGIIRPKAAKVLAVRSTRASVKTRAKFKSRRGWIIFGRKVRATKPNRFMNRAVLKSELQIKKIFEGVKDQIIKKLSV